jgi:oligoendopeptidase F
LSLKDLAGSDAWGKFFGDLSSKIEVEADIEGTIKKYRESDLMVLLKDHRPEIRQKAWSLLIKETENLESNALEALNNLILDHKIDDNLRGFSTPHESSLIGNQITQAVLDSLRTAIKSKIPVLQSFTKLKSEILNIEKLEIYDIYAEIAFEGLELPKYDWDTAKNIILEAFGQFNPKFKEIAELFFEKNWIDAADRPQKRGGAFCSSFGPGFHPVILCTYKDRFEDVLTVAHELGHGIHSYLTENAQSLINSNYTMSTAEIASLCCETIVFDKLIETINDPRLKLQLYCNKIEDESANIFMAGLSYFEFELAVHSLYRENGPISKEQIRDLWLTNRYENIFGNLVNKTKGAEFSWLRVHHWVYVFYNYVYASGLLISSSIYNVLKADQSKIKDYLEVLELGGSKSPVDLLKRLGLNIEGPTFWDIGLDLYAAQVAQAKSLWNEVKQLK